LPKIKVCPICGERMRRIYVKNSYDVLKRSFFGLKVKRTSRLEEIGWYCPYCKNVELD